MQLPNKITRYENSLISKFPLILAMLKKKSFKPKDLFESCKNDFENISEFVQTVECLFALSKVKLNEETGEVELC